MQKQPWYFIFIFLLFTKLVLHNLRVSSQQASPPCLRGEWRVRRRMHALLSLRSLGRSGTVKVNHHRGWEAFHSQECSAVASKRWGRGGEVSRNEEMWKMLPQWWFHFCFCCTERCVNIIYVQIKNQNQEKKNVQTKQILTITFLFRESNLIPLLCTYLVT